MICSATDAIANRRTDLRSLPPRSKAGRICSPCEAGLVVGEGCWWGAGPVRSGESVGLDSVRCASQRPGRQRGVLNSRGCHGQRVGYGLGHERRRGTVETAPGSSRLDRRRRLLTRLRPGGALAAAVLGRRAFHGACAGVPPEGELELGGKDPHAQRQGGYRCGSAAPQQLEADGHGRLKIRETGVSPISDSG